MLNIFPSFFVLFQLLQVYFLFHLMIPCLTMLIVNLLAHKTQWASFALKLSSLLAVCLRGCLYIRYLTLFDFFYRLIFTVRGILKFFDNCYLSYLTQSRNFTFFSRLFLGGIWFIFFYELLFRLWILRLSKPWFLNNLFLIFNFLWFIHSHKIIFCLFV